MLNIVIVAKDSHIDLYKTLTALENIFKKQNNLNYITNIFYSSKSKLSRPNTDEYKHLKLNLTISNDDSVYSAMNFALNSISFGHIMFLNCGDIITNEIKNLIVDLNSSNKGKTIFLYNSLHKDLSKRKKGLYVSKFSPRWYSIVFGMKCEHCCFIAPINLLKKFKFDERLKYAADYKLIINSLKLANRLNYEIIDNRNLILVKPNKYGISSKKSFEDSINEEIFALVSSQICIFEKLIGYIYRSLRIIIYYLLKTLKIKIFIREILK